MFYAWNAARFCRMSKSLNLEENVFTCVGRTEPVDGPTELGTDVFADQVWAMYIQD